MRAELFSDYRCNLGEGVSWDPATRMLSQVDILERKLHRMKLPGGKVESFSFPEFIGCAVSRASGGYLVALQNGIHAYDPKTGQLEFWEDPEADKPDNRFNDGKCDPAGRFWVGTMSLSGKKAKGSLYCLDRDRNLRTRLTDVHLSNGLCWDASRERMYFIDTPTRKVDCFDYDLLTGEISDRRSVVRFPESRGLPDGMTIDARGNLWIAEWDGACVSCWDPEQAQLLEVVDVPARRVTCCAFGGKNLDTLFITTANAGATKKEKKAYPEAGGLFACQPGVIGVPADAFAG